MVAGKWSRLGLTAATREPAAASRISLRVEANMILSRPVPRSGAPGTLREVPRRAPPAAPGAPCGPNYRSQRPSRSPPALALGPPPWGMPGNVVRRRRFAAWPRCSAAAAVASVACGAAPGGCGGAGGGRRPWPEAAAWGSEWSGWTWRCGACRGRGRGGRGEGGGAARGGGGGGGRDDGAAPLCGR